MLQGVALDFQRQALLRLLPGPLALEHTKLDHQELVESQALGGLGCVQLAFGEMYLADSSN